MLFDVRTEKWEELAKMSVGNPEWSREGDYICLDLRYRRHSILAYSGFESATISWSKWPA